MIRAFVYCWYWYFTVYAVFGIKIITKTWYNTEILESDFTGTVEFSVDSHHQCYLLATNPVNNAKLYCFVEKKCKISSQILGRQRVPDPTKPHYNCKTDNSCKYERYLLKNFHNDSVFLYFIGFGSYRITPYGCILYRSYTKIFYDARTDCVAIKGDLVTLGDNDVSMFKDLFKIFGK